jgi:homocysteine S-methyltransferase
MKKIVLLDGGMGQELMKRSKSSPHPLWSAKVLLDEPELVENVHVDFIKSGAKVITLNTYSITPERLARDGDVSLFEELQNKAITVAQRAREKASAHDVRIAGCLPPLFGSYHPEVAPKFEECVERYLTIVEQQYKEVDLFLCETMSSIKEAKASITAAKTFNTETWCALSIEDNDKSLLRSKEPLEDAMVELATLNHQANLLNCSTPEAISVAIKKINLSEKYFGAYANGFTSIDALELGGTVDSLKARQELTPPLYAKFVSDWVSSGATIVGGCCEISPLHIRKLRETLERTEYELVSRPDH